MVEVGLLLSPWGVSPNCLTNSLPRAGNINDIALYHRLFLPGTDTAGGEHIGLKLMGPKILRGWHMNGAPWIIGVVSLTLLAYFVRGWLFRHSFRSIEDFFNYSRSIPQKLFSSTFIATNVTFASIYLVIAAITYERGNLTLWIIFAWILGLVLFRTVFPRISTFFDQGHTLHEFLGLRYDSDSLRKLASICTITVFVGTLGIEFWGIILLLEGIGLRGLIATGTIATGIALLTAAYTALGGFKAAVETDRWQRWLILALTFVMIGVVFNVLGLLPAVGSSGRTELIALLFAPSSLFSDIVFIVAMLILFIPFNFCVMDMWQRCTATQKGQRLDAIRSVGSWKTSVTFAIVFLVPILVGLSSQSVLKGVTFDDSIRVLPEFLKQIAGPAWLRVPVLCVIYAGFFAALMSTADTLLINVAYTFMFDILGPLRNIDYADLDKAQRYQTISVFRFWVFAFGLCAVPLIFVGLTIYQLIFAVFSSQVVLFTPILFAILRPEHAQRRSRGAWWSIVLGFLAAVISVIAGRLSGVRDLVYGAPVIAFGISVGVFFLWPRIGRGLPPTDRSVGQ